MSINRVVISEYQLLNSTTEKAAKEWSAIYQVVDNLYQNFPSATTSEIRMAEYRVIDFFAECLDPYYLSNPDNNNVIHRCIRIARQHYNAKAQAPQYNRPPPNTPAPPLAQQILTLRSTLESLKNGWVNITQQTNNNFNLEAAVAACFTNTLCLFVEAERGDPLVLIDRCKIAALARTEWVHRSLDIAEKLAFCVFQKDAGNAAVLGTLAGVRFDQKLYQEAYNLSLEVLRELPLSLHAQEVAANAAFCLGRPDEARSRALALLERDPVSRSAHRIVSRTNPVVSRQQPSSQPRGAMPK